MKKILLCTDGSNYAENSYKYGAWIAKKLDGTINVLSVTDVRSQQAVSTGNLSGSLGLGASEDLLNKLVDLEHEKAKINHQRAKLILNTAKESLKNEGVTDVKLSHKTGFLVDLLHEFEENADLIILGKRGENAEFAAKHLGANLERIVRSSKKPCFVTPRDFQTITKVLVAYDGSPTGDKILEFLKEGSLVKNVPVNVLMVEKSGDKNRTPTRLDQAVLDLQGAGIDCEGYFIQGEVEKAISDHISNHDINFLIMGAYGHSRIRSLVIGSTTAQMLRSTRIPVLLFR